MISELNTLIKQRRKLGMTRRLMARLTGYSVVWLERVENRNERRVSQEFVEKYRQAIEKYEKLLND